MKILGISVRMPNFNVKKAQRVNVMIYPAQNQHRKYLYNDMVDLMNRYKFGGEFRNESIKLSSAPRAILKVLKKLKINYEQK